MKDTIKKQFHLMTEDWILGGVLILGGFLVGQILHALILHTDPTATHSVPLGSILAAAAAVVFVIMESTSSIRTLFHMEVSMGCTRKRFYVSFFTVQLTSCAAAFLLLLFLAWIENDLNAWLYPGLAAKLDFMEGLLKWGVPAALAVTTVGDFCGTLLMRFGRTAFWILWAVWMLLCVGFPQVHDAIEEAPGSFFGVLGMRILEMTGKVPTGGWMALLAAAVIGCAVGAWQIIRKQEVIS